MYPIPPIGNAPTGSSSSSSSARFYTSSSGQPQPVHYPRSQTPPIGCNLRLGDRVVYHDGRYNDTPEWGTVKWLGSLAPYNPRYTLFMAGVEFDNPIGGGTGRYSGFQIFDARLNHASFVPIVGLIKDDDFVAATADTSSSSDACRLTSRRLSTVAQSSVATSLMRVESIANTYDLEEGSCVEVTVEGQPLFGVVRYVSPRLGNGDHLCGVEVESSLSPSWCDRHATNGASPDGVRHFECPEGRGIYVLRSNLQPDQRFTTPIFTDLGDLDSGSVEEYVPPCGAAKPLSHLCGAPAGIQGHKNSCYLDTTLYSMFAHTQAFDHLLLREPTRKDAKQYTKVRDVLRHEIVYPLRMHNYVRADHTQALRKLLADASGAGHVFETEERDPEELLCVLLGQILRPPSPYIVVRHEGKNSGEHLFALLKQAWSASAASDVPDVQFLLERHCTESALSFANQPRIFMLQLPRSGPERAYSHIAPNGRLDLTHLLHNSPRPCFGCGGLANSFCAECYMTSCTYLAEATFCLHCFHKSHCELDHAPSEIRVDNAIRQQLADRRLPPVEHHVHLAAVLCIESSHYVAFARAQSGTWLFYDSFADLLVPAVTACEDIAEYLTSEGIERVRAQHVAGQMDALPHNVVRLLKDAYVCLYLSHDAHMYV